MTISTPSSRPTTSGALVPDQLDADVCRRIGAAFARFAADADGAARVLVARDMRPPASSWPPRSPRACSTRASTSSTSGWRRPTSSTSPPATSTRPARCSPPPTTRPQYNGIKMCLAGAKPGRRGHRPAATSRPMAAAGLDAGRRAGHGSRRTTCSPTSPTTSAPSSTVGALRPLKVVADTANGMGGLVVPAVFEGLPFDLEVLYGELDGTFPNHPADPIQPENQRDLSARVLETGADVGLAFDGDADRVFLVDEQGERRSRARPPPPSSPPAMLAKEPGATILHNLHLLEGRARGRPRARRHADPHPGRPQLHQGGHGRDRRRVRRRALGALLLPRQLPGRLRAHRRARRARAAVPSPACRCPSCASPFERYAASGEINTEVDDPHAVIERVADALRRRRPGPPRRPHRRPAATGGSTCGRRNTEPLLRLNLEAPDARRRSTHRVAERAADLIEGDADDGARPAAARDPGLPRGQGPAAVLRGRGRALQPAPASAATRIQRRHPDHARSTRPRRSTTPSTSA